MNRRNFIKTIGASIAAAVLTESFDVSATAANRKEEVINFPGKVFAFADGKTIELKGFADRWQNETIAVNLSKKRGALTVEIEAPTVSLSEIRLEWRTAAKTSSLLLNDHWERTYGDVSWHKPAAEEFFPWYFLEKNGDRTTGYGVKTGGNAFCAWTLEGGRLSLRLDTQCGASGVQLGARKLNAAEIVTIESRPGETAFAVARRFTKKMCDRPRLPKQPVYGINDWYFSYGKNSADLIMRHTELIAPMAEGLKNRPFSVVDDGWFEATKEGAGDVLKPNEKFGDMQKLAARINGAGMRPGLWTRPLTGTLDAKESLLLPPMGYRKKSAPVLDPSIPENLERVRRIFQTYKNWDYELVKFDYTSWDIFQRWGFQMLKDRRMSREPGWTMNDKTRTNAEIIRAFYKTIREAAGGMYIIGCNTFSHLSAGLFEIMRIGDDTSGNDWARTLKMGVNTLAFRGLTHNTFYAADGDCVGLTTKVPWEKNKQWMELLAKSGTPLFISAQPEAVGAAQKATIKECFKLAASNLPVGEPLDWLENPTPAIWKLNGKIERFEWD